MKTYTDILDSFLNVVQKDFTTVRVSVMSGSSGSDGVSFPTVGQSWLK